MSRSFLYMLVTVSGSTGVYWLWTFKLGLNENAGLIASTLAAIILASLFYRLKNR